MSVKVDVDPGGYDAASKVFGQTIADELFHAVTTMDNTLSGCGAMAGSDPGGTKWGHAYDDATKQVLGVTEDVINGTYKLADLLETTGFNHGQANSASTPGGTVITSDSTSYSENSVSLGTPPSAAGGSGGGPPGWSLISGLVGYVWPNGHQDKLNAAGSAWSTASTSVSIAGYEVPGAVSHISVQKSPEVANATQACTAMEGHISDLSAAYAAMGTACHDYAHHLDEAHSKIIDECWSLLEWTIAIEAAGAALAFFSVGISEGAAQAAVAARCAAVAARVGTITARLVEVAGEVAQAILNAMAKVIEVSRNLRLLLSARLSKATAAIVEKLPFMGKTAEGAAIEGLQKAPTLASLFGKGKPTATELMKYAESQGWKATQTATGPLKYVDDNGVERIVIKRGSPRTPGSEHPHVALKDASGERIDPFGNPVTRNDPGNHTPIDYDIEGG